MSIAVFGQTAPNFWKQVNYSDIRLPENSETMAMPSEYLTYSLNFDGIVNYLKGAPSEGSYASQSGSFRLVLPLADGSMEAFSVWESSVMDPALAIKYPEIRTFAGHSVRHPSVTTRFGYGYDAFHAVILGGPTTTVITWYANNQNEYHLCFDPLKFDIAPNEVPGLICGHIGGGEEIDPIEVPADPVVSFRGGGEGALVARRTYRVAISTTGEYAQMHGGTLQSVLSSLVTAVSALNSVLEKETAVKFILVPNIESVIFLDPDGDPFFNANNGSGLMAQNQAILNSNIGSSFYDVGQVFTGPCTDVGGVVSGTACSQGKGRGTTCNFTSNVTAVMLNTGAHEFGHQLSAGHTWSNCPGQEGQLSDGTAWEPGSGSTILSYQGACGPSNIPGGGNIIYHAGTIGQIWSYTRTGGGAQCGLTFESANHAPEIIWPYNDGFNIPISTPFELEAAAIDEDGNAMTYAWNQMNLGPSAPLGQQIGNSPSFRTYDPSNSPKRSFPRLPVLLNNGFEDTELLPAYSRNLKFRFVVRDNNVDEGSGGVTWQELSFNATASAGPFLVTYPNEGTETWTGGEEVEISWDVANTNNDLVDCQAVNIRLSVDGGLTYPHLLVGATLNDGAEKVFIPSVNTSKARIRVEAANNIFFDISNSDFSIQAASIPGYTLTMSPQYQQVCVPNEAELQIFTNPILSYNTPIQLDIVEGLPAGVNVSFSKNPLNPGENAVLKFNMDKVTDNGVFEVTLRAVAGTDTIYRSLFFNVIYNNFKDLALLSPTDGESGLGLAPDFTWTDLPQADLYDFQLATSPLFDSASMVAQAFNLTDAFYVPNIALVESQIYFWRVRPSNKCGQSDYTSPKAFQTFTIACIPYVSTDVPKNISSNGLPVVKSVIPIATNGVISDLNVKQLKGYHDLLPHIEAKLISPAGTECVLFSKICGNVQAFNMGLNDDSPIDIECPPINNKQYRPQEPLATFNGEGTLGNWTLEIAVINPSGQGGALESWNLEFCSTISPNHPFLVNNDTIYVKPLETAIIHNYEVAVEDIDNNGSELRFMVVDATDEGYLSRNGVPLGTGDYFTMTDIHLQHLTYTNTNPDAVYDFFTYVVEDGTEGWLGTPRVSIVIDENAVTSAREIQAANGMFLFPNPAKDYLMVNFYQPVEEGSTAAIHDLSGRLVAQHKLKPTQQQLQLDMKELAPGIYFLSLRSANGVFTEKFIVQR